MTAAASNDRALPLNRFSLSISQSGGKNGAGVCGKYGRIFRLRSKRAYRGLQLASGLLIGLLLHPGVTSARADPSTRAEDEQPVKAEGQQAPGTPPAPPATPLPAPPSKGPESGAAKKEGSQESLPEDPEEAPRVPLTVEELLKTWIFFTAEMAEREATWNIAKGATEADNELVCAGKPFGYLRSQQEFEDFEFGLEWKYPQDPNGNSGILIHTVEDDKIWPKSLQVQLHAPAAGSIFPTGGARSDNTGTAMGLSKPVNEWNTCVVVSRKGRVTAVINGQKVGEVTGSQPRRGRICLQSEGAEIRFRRFWVRKFPLRELSETIPQN